MSLKLVERVTVEDGPALAKNNMSAFWEQKWWNIMWEPGTLDTVIEKASLRMPRNLLKERNLRRHQMVIDTATGEPVGYARWIMPESHADKWLEAQVPGVSDEDEKRYDEQFAKVDWTIIDLPNMDDPIHEMQKRNQPKNAFIKLDYLCAGPKYQRRGIASMLVQSGIEKADELGLDIFLVAMGRGATAMYQKNGFEVVDEDIQNLDKWGFEGLYETFSVHRPYKA